MIYVFYKKIYESNYVIIYYLTNQFKIFYIIIQKKLFNKSHFYSEFGYASNAAAIGGLSVTGCLADFSVYIFHPYGGKKTGKYISKSDNL